MKFLISLTREFFIWWFVLAPRDLLRHLFIFWSVVEHQLSFLLILKTFFKPWRGEYRPNLVRFAIFFGITIKSVLLLVDGLVLLILAIINIGIVSIWLVLPIASVLMILGVMRL